MTSYNPTITYNLLIRAHISILSFRLNYVYNVVYFHEVSQSKFVTHFVIPIVLRILVTFTSKQWCSITIVVGRQVKVCCQEPSRSEWPNQPASSQRFPAPKPAASNVNTPSWWRSPGEMPSLVTHVQSTLVLIPPWCWLDPNKIASLADNSSRVNNVSRCTVWRT
jgi:hypothetical protein